jgi:hypothetical protein
LRVHVSNLFSVTADRWVEPLKEKAKEDSHPVVFFNRNPTGKNRERDFQEEPKRNPPDKRPAPAKQTGGREVALAFVE